MESVQILWIVTSVLGGLLLVSLIVSFFVSRKSQKIMQSLVTLMTHPERARVHDAVRVLDTILADEMAKLESNFQTIRGELQSQINAADELQKVLGAQNDKLVATADDATKKIALMSQRLDNTVSDLRSVTQSSGWQDVELVTEKFTSDINELLGYVDKTSQSVTERVSDIQNRIEA